MVCRPAGAAPSGGGIEEIARSISSENPNASTQNSSKPHHAHAFDSKRDGVKSGFSLEA